jgi:demethylmenaquinone methyltransferase / 2-methoxy-6-polyprenyl-1,4-benzoquinol methylase
MRVTHRPDPERIHSMFSQIAQRYDRANTVLSAGIHHRWRRTAVKWSGARAGDRILDCATGTGDLAIAFKRTVGPAGEVVAIDFVENMIELARQKSADIRFEVADVTVLPFETDTFDVASIAFGIRNVGDPMKGIAEMTRVVKRGGRVVVLEFGKPKPRAFAAAYDLYRTRMLPSIGGLITGQRRAYEYLDQSSVEFPHGEEFAALMRNSASFDAVEFRPLTFGIAYLYRGVKK